MLALLAASAVPAQGDPLDLYEQGRYAEAARTFRQALERYGDDAMLNYNLALTLWRQGNADEAETSAEKAATLSDGRLDALRDGILGNLRFEAALEMAKDQPKEEPKDRPRSGLLEQAVDLMVQARKHYQRGAVRPGAGPALARNLERAIRKEEELRKELAEQKKKEEKQEKKDQDKKDKDQKDQDKKDQDQEEQDKKDSDKRDQEKKDQEKKAAQQPKQPKDPKQQPLGKFDPNKELTPEQKKRLLDMLKQIEAELRELQKQKQASRPKVKKDW